MILVVLHHKEMASNRNAVQASESTHTGLKWASNFTRTNTILVINCVFSKEDRSQREHVKMQTGDKLRRENSGSVREISLPWLGESHSKSI